MTTQELKQYIDRVLGNSIRCLLPSYWWKRVFGAVVDNMVNPKDVKTINGESILGEGDLRVGVKSVESVEELNALDAQAGDIATIGKDTWRQVSVGSLERPGTFNITEVWDKLTRIDKVEKGTPYSNGDTNAFVWLHSKSEFGSDVIQLGCRNGVFGFARIKIGQNEALQEFTIDELNTLLKENDYRFVAYNTAVDVDVIDETIKLYVSSVEANAYIKGETWERLAKEYVVSSEEELNALSVEKGTIAKVAYDYEVRSYRNTKISNSTDKDFDRVVGLDVLSVPSSSFEITIYAQELEANNKSLSVICYGTGRIDGVIRRIEGNVSYREEVYNLALDYSIKADEVKRFNELLRSMDCLLEHNSYVPAEFYALIDSAFRFHIAVRAVSDAYIKGETWDKLAKAENVVSSVEELNTINAKAGDLAKVASERKRPKFADFYQSNAEELASIETVRANIEKFTKVNSIDVNTPPYSFSAGVYAMLLLSTESPLKIELAFHPQVAGAVVYDSLGGTTEYLFFDTRESSEINIDNINAINNILKTGDYRYIPSKYPEQNLLYDVVFKANQELGYADLYIKGETWTRLLKEGDVTGGGEATSVFFWMPTSPDGLTQEQKQKNAESYRKVVDGYNNLVYYDIKLHLGPTVMDALALTSPEIRDNKVELLYDTSDGQANFALISEDGSVEIEAENLKNHVEIREFKIGNNISDDDKAWNLETMDMVQQRKCIVSHKFTKAVGIFPANTTAYLSYFLENSFGFLLGVGVNSVRAVIDVASDGTASVTYTASVFTVDSSLSETSTNPVQNKAIKAYVDEKVANVGGTTIREFYTEDSLTDEQKAWNLETFQLFQENKCFIVLDSGSGLLPLSWHAGRSFVFQYGMINTVTLNYEITVSGDGSTTTRNVNYLPDEELSTTSANVVSNRVITAALNNKADKSDIKTINGESILGEGNIVVDIDTSDLATKEELNAKQDKIDDLEVIRSGAALGATALQEHQDISHLATKEEVIANEEVHAAALNDLNERLNNVGKSGVLTFYMPEGSTMPASMKEKNAKAFTQYLAAEEGVSVVLQNPAKIRIIPSSVKSSDEEIVLELVTSLFSADGTVSSVTVAILPDGDAVAITQ